MAQESVLESAYNNAGERELALRVNLNEAVEIMREVADQVAKDGLPTETYQKLLVYLSKQP